MQVWPTLVLEPSLSHITQPLEHLTPSHSQLGVGEQISIALPPAYRPSHHKGHPARKPSSPGMGS